MSEKGSRTNTPKPGSKKGSKANTPRGSKPGTPKGSTSNTPLPTEPAALAVNGTAEPEEGQELDVVACKYFI